MTTEHEESLVPIVGVLAACPHPMTASQLAAVLREEEGPVRLALVLLQEARRVRCVDGQSHEQPEWTLEGSTAAAQEGISAVRRAIRRKQILCLSQRMDQMLGSTSARRAPARATAP